MKHSPENSTNRYNSQIDAALALFAKAAPASGLESRINAGLAAARRQTPVTRPRFHLLRPIGMGALATAAACGIVAGSIEHSHRSAALPPALRLNQRGGVGGAGAAIAPTHAVPAGNELKPGSLTRPAHSRATISPSHVHRANGATVPRSPYPPNSPAGDQRDPQN